MLAPLLFGLVIAMILAALGVHPGIAFIIAAVAWFFIAYKN